MIGTRGSLNFRTRLKTNALAMLRFTQVYTLALVFLNRNLVLWIRYQIQIPDTILDSPYTRTRTALVRAMTLCGHLKKRFPKDLLLLISHCELFLKNLRAFLSDCA